MADEVPRRSRLDEAANNTASLAFAFAFALGILGVGVPLVALGVGFDASQIGVLVGISGAAQLLARLPIAGLMRIVPDKAIVVVAGALIALSSVVLAGSTVFAAFVVAQVLQGTARAYFWTGAQTHAVRSATRSVGALSRMNLMSGLGALSGPFVAGVILERADAGWILATAAASGLASATFGLLLRRLPAFAKRAVDAPRMWRRRELRPGIGMGIVSGGWIGLLNGYVSVLLAQEGHPAGAVGAIVAVSNLAILVGGGAVAAVRNERSHWSLLLAGSVVGASTIAFGFLAGDPLAAGACLAAAGFATGALQTLGPAAIADAVDPGEHGDAIAASGTYRAAALVASPFAGAAVVAFAPVGIAVATVGVLLLVPTLLGALGRAADVEDG